MPTKEEMLIEAYKRGLLTGQKKAAYDEAVRRGLIKAAPAPTDNRGFLQKASDFFTGNDRETRATQDVPELGPQAGLSYLLGDDVPTLKKLGLSAAMLTTFNPEDQLKIIKANATEPVSEFYDEKGNLGVNVGGRIVMLNKPGASPLDAAQLGATAAAFTPAGRVTAAGPTLASQVVRGGLTSAATQGAIDVAQQTAGRDDQVSYENVRLGDVATAGIVGAGMPFVFRAVSNAIQSLRGASAKPITVLNQDGTLTDDAIATLQKANVADDQLDDLVRAQLTKEGVMTPEEAARFNLFKRYEMNPTKAQITQSADDFQAQQELIKRSNGLRTAVETQDVDLANRMRGLAEKTGAVTDEVIDTGDTVFQAITKKATDMDDQINLLYQEARARAPQQKIVRFDNLLTRIKDSAGQNQLSNGAVRAAYSDLKARGLVAGGAKPGGRASVETAEEIRQGLNKIIREGNPSAQRLARQFIDALDEDVLSAAGDDLFSQARAAKAAFHGEFSKAARNKWDVRTGSMVQKVLSNEIPSEKVFEKFVLSRSTPIDELQQLNKFLTTGTEEQVQMGRQAWQNLQGQTLYHLVEKATSTAGKTEGGYAVFSGTQLKREMSRIGQRKLEELLGRDGLRQLNDLAEIARLRIPVTGTQQGLGPSAQAIKEVSNKLSMLHPILGYVKQGATALQDMRAANQALMPANRTAKALTEAQRLSIELTKPKPAAGMTAAGQAAVQRSQSR